jgi:DNA polymerase III delta subunit
MFFLFYGDDKIKARNTAQKNILAAQKKHPNASFFKLNAENFSEDKINELTASQGLFYSAFIIFADNLCEETETSEIFTKRLKEIKESPNFFIILEGKLNKKELDKFKKYAEKVEEFVDQKIKPKKYDIFQLTNAIRDRDKKKAWTIYQEILNEGFASEEVHGVVFWQIKTLISDGLTRHYTLEQLKKMSARLFNMYHLAHRGEVDFAVALEAFILGL